VWTAGFAVHPIAAASGIAVEDNGQITVDRTMRSVSHPDVFAAGDSAFVIGENGKPMPMSCASAGYTCMQATSAIIGDLTGAKVKQTALVYFGNHISLGRKDAIFQLVDDKAESKRGAMVGRTAARVKSAVLRLSAVGVGHPTWGMPARKHRLASSARPARAATATAAERADKEVAA
ncbi:MAG TPA: FAD-dependent oxidoreductase, partial [Glycomyces sp.]|nr:FAD-dependent oxidoreductase [Glycomyces sp.]